MMRIFLAFCCLFGLALALPLDSSSGLVKVGEYQYVEGGETRIKYYFASTTPSDQDAAEKACHSYVNGRLATVVTRAEFEALAKSLPPSGLNPTTYFTAGRKVGGSWFWMTTGAVIDDSLLFWDPSGIYPIGMDGAVLALQKSGESVPTNYSDSWGFTAEKQYVCEAGYYNP